MRVRKLPILLPILLVIVLLAGAAYLLVQNEQVIEASHTDLGAKYLNEMNYSGAVAEYAEELAQNPTDVSARVGLAQAYLGLGEKDSAAQVIQPLLENDAPEAYRVLVEMQRRDNDLGQALLTAQRLVERTDAAEDYALRDDLLRQALQRNSSYAVGTDQALMISRQSLLSKGSNLFGQLGTDRALAQEQTQEQFMSAGFQGTPARVYCAGRTSYVVDTAGDLWAAGENRWGQMGVGAIGLSPKAGWTKVVDTGDVAAVAGTTGALFVLRTDGSLWYAGQGGVTALSEVSGIETVSAIAAYSNTVAVLTLTGELYTLDTYRGTDWVRMAKGVKQFSLCNGVLVWLTEDGELCCSGYRITVPENWRTTSDGVIAPFALQHVACDGRGVLLQKADGTICRLYNGQLSEWAGRLSILSLHGEGDVVVLETNQGVWLWDLSQENPTQLVSP